MTLATPTLRAFTPADQDAARALILAGLGERFGFIDETRNPDIDDIAAQYLAQGRRFLVAELAGTLVGTGGLLLEPDGSCQLVRVSVRHDLRRQGIARLLVTALLAEARACGRRRVWVETNETVARRHRALRTHGILRVRAARRPGILATATARVARQLGLAELVILEEAAGGGGVLPLIFRAAPLAIASAHGRTHLLEGKVADAHALGRAPRRCAPDC